MNWKGRIKLNWPLKPICFSSKHTLVRFLIHEWLCKMNKYRLLAHPHSKLALSALEKVSTNPILFTQVPNLEVVVNKLGSFIDGASIPNSTGIKQTLSTEFLTYLKGKFSSGVQGSRNNATSQIITKWSNITLILAAHLPSAQLFPVVDLWRLAILDDAFSSWCATTTTVDPIQVLLVKALSTLSSPDSQLSARNYILTTLRLLSNTFSNPALVHRILSPSGKRPSVTALLVSTLLHQDASVRTAAASLAFNISASIQKTRVDQMRSMNGSVAALGDDSEWEVEVVSVVLESIRNETQNEDIGEFRSFSLLVIHPWHYISVWSSSIDGLTGFSFAPIAVLWITTGTPSWGSSGQRDGPL